MTLDFSTLHLIVDDESPDIDKFKPLFENPEDSFSLNGIHYLITKENINDTYLWLYAKYGTSLPHSPTVYNTQHEKEENNPRTTDQIETDEQLFGLYSLEKKVLYLSRQNKKTVFEGYLRSRLDQDVTIKAFFKNVDEFTNQIKIVEKIKLVVKNNLFSSHEEILKIFSGPKDMYGLGMPEDFSLEVNFKNAKLTDAFISWMKKIRGWKNSMKVDSLMCVGRDDKNFETIFNIDSFIQKVSVPATKNDQGMYEPEAVKRALISKIEEVE